MIDKLGRLFAWFCVATVLTQVILFGYVASRGGLSSSTVTQILALVNGIDITGGRLQRLIERQDEIETPSYAEVLDARKMSSLEMSTRRESQRAADQQLRGLLQEIRQQRDELAGQRSEFESQLEQLRTEATDEGMRRLIQTVSSLEADAAKDQLMMMCREGQRDRVVRVLQALPSEARKDVLGNFASPAEKEELGELLQLIAEGEPVAGLIDRAAAAR